MARTATASVCIHMYECVPMVLPSAECTNPPFPRPSPISESRQGKGQAGGPGSLDFLGGGDSVYVNRASLFADRERKNVEPIPVPGVFAAVTFDAKSHKVVLLDDAPLRSSPLSFRPAGPGVSHLPLGMAFASLVMLRSTTR